MKTNFAFLLIACSLLLFSHAWGADYYWVGGQGSWSDINHWATSSGGTNMHAQVPTSGDDVFFDQNSFDTSGDTLFIEVSNAVGFSVSFNDIDVPVVLSGGVNSNLRIYGSLTLSSQLINEYQGTLFFEAVAAGYTINMYGFQAKNEIHFNGLNGEWTMLSDVVCEKSVRFNHGHLITAGNKLDCEGFFSMEDGANRILDIKNSTIHAKTWTVNGDGLKIYSQGSKIILMLAMVNQEGDRLHYYDVDMTEDGGVIQSINVQSVFNVITYFEGGVLGGTNTIDSLLMGPKPCAIKDADSIYYASLDMVALPDFHLVKGEHVIHHLTTDGPTQVRGSNVIDSLMCQAPASVKGTNIISQRAVFSDLGSISDTNEVAWVTMVSNGSIGGLNIVRRAEFKGNGMISGRNVFDTLSLFPGKYYELDDEYTIADPKYTEVTKYLDMQGVCEKPVIIHSDSNSVQALLKINAGCHVNSEYLILRDVKAQGSSAIAAPRSIDLGNNAGWDFVNPLNGRNLHWVGGVGLWSDPAHWSLSSNGAPGECPPRPIDDVFFDSAFDSLNIDLSNAMCRNMDWTGCSGMAKMKGSVKLTLPKDTVALRIYGSLKFTDNMINMFSGDIHFSATTDGYEIDPSIQSFGGKMIFDGRDGGWSFRNEMTVADTIFYNFGKLTTLDNDIHCMVFYSQDSTRRIFDLGKSTMTLYGGQGTVYWMNGTYLSLVANQSTIVSKGPMAVIRHDMENMYGNRFRYNNIVLEEEQSQLQTNGAPMTIFNLVDVHKKASQVLGDCKIDTLTFYEDAQGSFVKDSDSIRALIIKAPMCQVVGKHHVIDIMYMHEAGMVFGGNEVDTAYYFKGGILKGKNLVDTLYSEGVLLIDSIIGGFYNTIHRANLKCNATMIGDNIFDSLYLNPTHKYTLNHGWTQTVHDLLSLQGRCTGSIMIQTEIDGEQATLKKTSGEVQGEYLTLRDIVAQGDAPFVAGNSVDMGNNVGWDISEGDPKGLYWVGGTGNWSDSLHWAPQSGGIGGYCIPSPRDDVFFDENSFFEQDQKVTVDINDATCRNMTWQGAGYEPAFASEQGKTMRIHGSLQLNPAMKLMLNGAVSFEAKVTDCKVACENNQFPGQVHFNGMGGGWTLLDMLNTADTLKIIQGNLSTGDHDVASLVMYSDYTFPRQLELGQNSFYVMSKDTAAWYVNGVNFNLIPAQNTIVSLGDVITEHGDKVHYNNVILLGDTLWQSDVYTTYNRVTMAGELGFSFGNCTIDSLFGQTPVYIYDSDTLGYLYLEQNGIIGNPTLDSRHVVTRAEFLDTTAVYGVCVFDSLIAWDKTSVLSRDSVLKYAEFNGTTLVQGFNHMENAWFGANGDFKGENTFGNLTLVPGSTYRLAENKRQTVYHKLEVMGVNCYPVTIKSFDAAQQAEIFKDDGVVAGNFIEMQGIKALGGADFYAGTGSFDLGNNSGWIFDDAPGTIVGFPADTSVCDGYDVVISTDYFPVTPNTTFKWHDNSTADAYHLKPGELEVSVTITYNDDCLVQDTILINWMDTPVFDLGAHAPLCEGDTFNFPQSINPDWVLQWDGDLSLTHDFLVVNSDGKHWVDVTNQYGCAAADTIDLAVVPIPVVDLGNDTTLEYGNTLVLDAGNFGADYFWSSGENDQLLEVDGDGIYWVVVTKDGCAGSDTIRVGEYPDCKFGVPNAFTPNGDGRNEILYVRGSGVMEMEFMLFNRRGDMVFHSRDINYGWDGIFNQEIQSSDVYMYYLRIVCESGVMRETRGNVTLIR